jgi:hypothetical protein
MTKTTPEKNKAIVLEAFETLFKARLRRRRAVLVRCSWTPWGRSAGLDDVARTKKRNR